MLVQPQIRGVIKGQNRYCGPAAVSIVAGIDTTRAARLLRQVSGKTMICGISNNQVRNALKLLGYEMTRIDLYKDTKTLFQWLKSGRSKTDMFLVASGHHYSIVQGDSYCCCQTMVVVPTSEAAHPRSRMESVFVVTKVAEVDPETVVRTPPKDTSWLKRITVSKKAKQYGIEIDDQTKHGGVLWVYGPDGMFTDVNEEQDPYFDNHYHDTWDEVEKAVDTYIALVKTPPIKEAACPSSPNPSS